MLSRATLSETESRRSIKCFRCFYLGKQTEILVETGEAEPNEAARRDRQDVLSVVGSLSPLQSAQGSCGQTTRVTRPAINPRPSRFNGRALGDSRPERIDENSSSGSRQLDGKCSSGISAARCKRLATEHFIEFGCRCVIRPNR